MSFAGLTATLVLSACGPKKAKADTFTYRGYTSALASNWNPHTWETNADSGVLGYLSEGFVSLAPLSTEGTGTYQWVFDMAESIEDVTIDNVDALVNFVGMTKTEANAYIEGLEENNPGRYVYQIKLREGLKWEDGKVINADSFIESGKRLLDPAMKNYRANLYYSGESALAGAMDYYFQGSTSYLDNVLAVDEEYEITAVFNDLEEGWEFKEGVLVQKGTGTGGFIALNQPLVWLGGETLKTYVDYYQDDLFDMDAWDAILAKVDTDPKSEDAFKLALTEENIRLFGDFLNASVGWGENDSMIIAYLYYGKYFPTTTFDSVGLQKVDDLTFNYVMQNPIELPQALVSFSSTWLVHEEVYDQNKDTTGKLTTTTYATKVENTMSYGPYKLQSLQTDKQMVFVKNPNWWGYTKDDNGRLVSTTNFKVNGEFIPQYVADTIVIDKLTDEAAKQKFLAGELSEYTPTASELSDYTLSDALYKVDETYTMSFFFNTNLDHLKEMDRSEGNKNSVVLSNINFRKAFSLSIDRAEWVTATAAYKPAYSLMNDIYYYDVWNNPDSVYRNSAPAMEAIVDLYGVEYGPDKVYKTLEDAYKSINGYNLTEAKALMATAFTELKTAGLIEDNAEIKIRIAYKKGALESDDLAQLALLNKYINDAVAGSGFGKVTLEGVGNVNDRYGDVPKGKFAIGYGAWGGAAFYPFRNMEVYTNSEKYGLNEAANWNPATETLKIEFDDFSDTLTWKEWGGALTGSGKYATRDNEFKLKVTAILEKEFLGKYYRIPLAASTTAFLLSFQVSYLTETYNIMYDFGGFRLMKFNYTDAQWEAFVRSNNGVIDYR